MFEPSTMNSSDHAESSVDSNGHPEGRTPCDEVPEFGNPIGGLAQEVGKSSPFELKEQEVFLNLVRTADRLAADFHKLFKDHGLSQPKYNALRILRGNKTDCGHGIPCQRIADQLVSREPDITRLLDRLAKDGLISRERCVNDRRVVLVCLTAKGLELVNRLDEPIRAMHRAQLEHLGADNLRTLNDLLYRARHPEAAQTG